MIFSDTSLKRAKYRRERGQYRTHEPQSSREEKISHGYSERHARRKREFQKSYKYAHPNQRSDACLKRAFCEEQSENLFLRCAHHFEFCDEVDLFSLAHHKQNHDNCNSEYKHCAARKHDRSGEALSLLLDILDVLGRAHEHTLIRILCGYFLNSFFDIRFILQNEMDFVAQILACKDKFGEFFCKSEHEIRRVVKEIIALFCDSPDVAFYAFRTEFEPYLVTHRQPEVFCGVFGDNHVVRPVSVLYIRDIPFCDLDSRKRFELISFESPHADVFVTKKRVQFE